MPELGSIEDQDLKEWRAVLREKPAPTPVKDLAAYLKGEFQAGEPLRMTLRRNDATGMRLADREVSRLEVINAIRRLPHNPKRTMVLLYIKNLPVEEVARQLNKDERTIYRYRAEALEDMAGRIYEWR